MSDRLNTILNNFIEAEVGLETGCYQISGSNNDKIWYGYRDNSLIGDKEDWNQGSERLIEILKEKDFGDYEIINSTVRGSEIEKINKGKIYEKT